MYQVSDEPMAAESVCPYTILQDLPFSFQVNQ